MLLCIFILAQLTVFLHDLYDKKLATGLPINCAVVTSGGEVSAKECKLPYTRGS